MTQDGGPMIELDGSIGEGGGQVLRTALGLSVATGQPFQLTGIRARRSKPGLAAQHLAAVRGVARLSRAEVEGDELGSQDLAFRPGVVREGKEVIDVGTAGSITLVLQACLLALVSRPTKVELVVHGGTDVPMAPPLSYCDRVILPLLAKIGYRVGMEVGARGFYPEGGGRVSVRTEGGDLLPFEVLEVRRPDKIEGVAFSQNLPEHVTRRMTNESKRLLMDVGPVNIKVEESKGISTGVGLVLYADLGRTILGSSCLGERGMPSELVARKAGEDLRAELRGATLDVHAADQILPYLALAQGPSRFLVREVSQHLRTQLSTVSAFLPTLFTCSERDGLTMVTVLPNRT